MRETFEQYSARILALSAGSDPMSILASTPSRIREFIDGRAPEVLHHAPGRWSIAQIVSHLSDAEIVFAYRVRMILSEPGGPIAAYDQEKWSAAQHAETSDPHASLALMTAIRESTIRLLRGLNDEELDRYGIHAERGKESVRHLIKLYAGHDRNHLAQIEKVLAEQGA
jgi:hypothetical protein